jgi:hypothetical protein
MFRKLTRQFVERCLRDQLRPQYNPEPIFWLNILQLEYLERGPVLLASGDLSDFILGVARPPGKQIVNRACIHVFDVIWYGEYEIDKHRFNEVEPTLSAFLNTLKTRE